MNKDQIELYELKRRDLSEVDKVYISGFKAAVDYLGEISKYQVIDTMEVKNNMGYMARRMIDLFNDDYDERMVSRLFHEMEMLTKDKDDEFDLDVIPDDEFDLDDEDIEDLDYDVEDDGD